MNKPHHLKQEPHKKVYVAPVFFTQRQSFTKYKSSYSDSDFTATFIKSVVVESESKTEYQPCGSCGGSHR